MHLTGSRKGVGTVVGGKSTAKGTKNYLRGLERDLVLDARVSVGAKAYLHEDGPKVGSKPHEIAFRNVYGKGAATLGWNKAGITNKEWEDLYDGWFDGKHVSKPGNRPAGIDPETGEKKNERVHNPGFDVQYRNPKSVSVTYALAGSQKQADDIDRAMEIAAQFAFREGIEAFARIARVTHKVNGKAVQIEETADLVAMGVSQHCARPTEETEARGAAPDPHTHYHQWIFSSCRVGDRWYTANEDGIKRTAEYRGELYSAEFARQLELLGYKIKYSNWDKAKNGKLDWEIDGVDPKLMDFLSSNSRRAKVLEKKFEKDHGRKPRPWEINDVMKVTRNKKNDKAFDAMPTRSRWTDDIAAHGFDITPIVTGESITREGEWRLAELERRLFDRGRTDLGTNAHGLLRGRHPAINGDRIKPAIARASVGLGILPEERDHYEALIREQLVVVKGAAEDRNVLYTTREQLALEQENRDMLKALAEAASADPNFKAAPFECSINLNIEQVVDRVVGRQNIRASEEQRQAVLHLVSGSKLETVIGLAGTGKSLVAKITDEVLEELGLVDQTITTALAGKVAGDMSIKVKADASGSVASLLRRVQMGKLKLTATTHIILDEAAVLDSRSMNVLLKLAVRSGARISMFGDPEQGSPILAAGWFQDHVRKYGNAMLTEVHRQKNALDVRDYKWLRDGRAKEALASMDERGRIHIATDAHSRAAEVMRDYKAARVEGCGSTDVRIIIGGSNQDVDFFNRFIQRYRMEQGEITGAPFRVRQQEDGRSWDIHQGDNVIFLKTYYCKETRTLVRNGHQGTMELLNPNTGRGTVTLEDGKKMRVSLNALDFKQTLGLADAMSTMKFQGSQCKRALIVNGPEQMSTANTIYSQTTRGEEASHVYLNAEDFAPLYSTPEYTEYHAEFREGIAPDARAKVIDYLGKAWSKKDQVQTALKIQEDNRKKKHVGFGIGRGL